MSDNNQLFKEFPSVSKEEWLTKIEKDLKGKPLESLNWNIGNNTIISPFQTKEDVADIDTSILQAGKENNNWQIAEDFLVEGDLKSINKELLESLMGGLEALRFFINQPLSKTDLDVLLNEVKLEYISIHFRLGKEVDTLQFEEEWQSFLQGRSQDLSEVNGTISKGKLQGENWKNHQIDASIYYAGLENIADELAQTIHLGVNEIMASANENESEKAFDNLFFTIRIGQSYFPAIAKIRALKLLWIRVAKGFNLETNAPEIEVEFAPDAYGEDKNTNMIRSATMAMSAIIGGAERLIVLPSDALTTQPNGFSRRIARNVQHLLKMESFFDRVIDPASGSYYIENLTKVFLENAWQKFLALEENVKNV